MDVEIQINIQEVEESLDMIISKLEKANSLADELASKIRINAEITLDAKRVMSLTNRDKDEEVQPFKGDYNTRKEVKI